MDSHAHFLSIFMPARRITSRRKVTISEKIALATRVREIKASLIPNQTIKGLARESNVAPSQLRKWEKQMDDLLQVRGPTTKHSLRPGRPGLLESVKDALMLWLSNLRQDGVPISIKMLCVHAINLKEVFGQKSTSAQYQIVRRLLRANGYSIRASTRVAQADPQVMRGIAGEFVAHVRNIINMPHRQKEWIMNMDQTAVFFSMEPRTTVDRRGVRTVPVRTTANGSVRITVSLAVTAAGAIMSPYLVMKGKNI